MANPSNYRYDAYSDIPSNITLTERHLVPAISPYIVTLTEVPVKSAPSTTSARYINDISGGSAVYGESLTEVSATPVAGQYYPDYHTNADNNENWNTGQILFAAADAGKIVEITYLAKGTLTGVTSAAYPSWWRDRGDGSDGDFYPTGNVTISGRKNYRSVYIPAGVTVSVSGFIDIRCQGMFINAGTINASGGGGLAGQQVKIRNLYGANIGLNGNPGEPAIGGGAGGAAGSSSDSGYYGVNSSGTKIGGSRLSLDAAGVLAGCYSEEILGGGGGSSPGVYSISEGGSTETLSGAVGGNGGGMIRIVAKSHKNIGSYISTGLNGTSVTVDSAIQTGGGGGGGGVILVVCERNLSSGTASVGGGAGGSYGGSGGAGWYRVIELGVN
ncbi:MAG TPA: hypothetical protein OIL90_12125 [Phascolarctobacterium faecium]|jgi:hypothetical protein|uniref:hypothetical protein n=1 Tax=Phascolarctobacterium faecium TaxID=33025 RepID=UPI00206506E9|nr:hypothetical protein [Phascolarctobacterium faecium]DAP89476.1 MAG TPA: hypothetical protein [Caudoviricetes sp.]HJI10847.1 hypothetical protein [Phascolarctobacterium faecium]